MQSSSIKFFFKQWWHMKSSVVSCCRSTTALAAGPVVAAWVPSGCQTTWSPLSTAPPEQIPLFHRVHFSCDFLPETSQTLFSVRLSKAATIKRHINEWHAIKNLKWSKIFIKLSYKFNSLAASTCCLTLQVVLLRFSHGWKSYHAVVKEREYNPCIFRQKGVCNAFIKY